MCITGWTTGYSGHQREVYTSKKNEKRGDWTIKIYCTELQVTKKEGESVSSDDHLGRPLKKVKSII